MKTKNEESIEQIVEEYAWERGTKKFLKQSNTTAFIVGGITYVFFVIWSGGGISFLLSIMPAMIAVSIVLVIFIFFSGLYRGKKKREKMIVALSEEEKRKIVIEYVKKRMQDISQSKQSSEKRIQELHTNILSYIIQLDDLEAEFFSEEYKKKHTQNYHPLPDTSRPSDFWTSRSAFENDWISD